MYLAHACGRYSRKDEMWWATKCARALVLLHFLFSTQALLHSAIAGTAPDSPGGNLIGINYGRLGDDLPSPATAVALIQTLGVGRVRIFDADAEVLAALANTGLEVVIMVKNEEIPDIAADEAVAIDWVQKNVIAFLPNTHIAFINVGNEVFSGGPSSLWAQLTPAMANIYSALVHHNLSNVIKVTTSFAMDVLSLSFPPSSGAFRANIEAQFITPLLHFLAQTHSPFFLNVYPYLTWMNDTDNISLAYALFNATNIPTILDNGLSYYNLLDAQLDAVAFAMAKLGFLDIDIVVSETGWPSAGGVGANPSNALTYNQRLVAKVNESPSVGTPLRRNRAVSAFIFALFNENMKSGAPVERNWGVFYANGTQVYSLQVAPPSSSPVPTASPLASPPGNGGAPSLSPVPTSSSPAQSPAPTPTAGGPVPTPTGEGSHSLSPVPTASTASAPSPYGGDDDDYAPAPDDGFDDSTALVARPQSILFQALLLVAALVLLS